METVISWFISAIVAYFTKFDFFAVLSTVSAAVDICAALISHSKREHTDDENALH